jgi:uncharacterized membrane protein
VVVSDICLANRPTVARAYRHIIGQRCWWRMLSTGFLLSVMRWAGSLLLLRPGIWVIVRGFLSSIVVGLEDRKGMDAIKRSFALTKGQAWRIFGLTLLPLLLGFAALSLCIIVVVLAVLYFLIGTARDVLVQVLSAPVTGITMVLLYYDQRAQRNDAQALAEDLMR